MPERVWQGLLFGVAAAVLGMLVGSVPAVLRFEEDLGLGALFQLRGPRPAPAEVVVVSLDKASSDAFGLPNEPARWPRTLHAELVERLATEGAMVVAFDVLFDDPDETAGDARLGAALQSAGNVVLTAYLRKSAVGSTRDGSVAVTAEQLVPPIQPVAVGALAVAPFPLPKVPVKVSQFWTYKTSAGGIATFPTVIFQAWMLRQSGGWYEDLRKACPGIASGFPATQSAVLEMRRVGELAQQARACLREHSCRFVPDHHEARPAAERGEPEQAEAREPCERARSPAAPLREHPQRVQRGGSFLCHESYCSRYRDRKSVV